MRRVGFRVAVAVTVAIAVVYGAAAAVLDAFVARRVLWEVDQQLALRLDDVSHLSDPLASRPRTDQGTDGVPVFLWWIAPSGGVRLLTAGGPAFPAGARASERMPLSVVTGTGTSRFEATPLRGGWLVAGQTLAGPSHIDRVLFYGELVLGPVLLATAFAGVLFIGWRASAPVEEARRRLLEFTADASHELRTPLTVIEAEIDLATSGPPDPAVDREALANVARESHRLQAIVEDMLWLARFDAAPPLPASEPVDLSATAVACVARFQALASSRGLALEEVIEPGIFVDAAPGWLDRLAGTLVDNACRYGARRARLTVAASGSRAFLRVEDDGPGIPTAARAALFDRFRRASDAPGGAGLGLSIADSVVRTTGGRWSVEGSGLGGACFEVSWRRSATVPPPTPVHTRGAP